MIRTLRLLEIKVLNVGYRDRTDGGFSYRISDIGGDIGNTRAYRAFILGTYIMKY